MQNFHETIRANPRFRRFEIGELLFAEYTCPLESRLFEIWSDKDYFVHVVSGEKTWHTVDGSWTLTPGMTLFFKKGGAIIEQHFGTDFCVLVFFLSDSIVREVILENRMEGGADPGGDPAGTCALAVNPDTGIEVFLDSMKHYFSAAEEPSEALLKLKLKELIVSILLSRRNAELRAYFHGLLAGEGPPIEAIMESNFRYRLSLEEFARLCHCSLSKFKRDFKNRFNEPPGRWILGKRLDFAAALLRAAGQRTVTDVAFESGFEDVSHFSRAFRDRFGESPSAYRSTRI